MPQGNSAQRVIASAIRVVTSRGAVLAPLPGAWAPGRAPAHDPPQFRAVVDRQRDQSRDATGRCPSSATMGMVTRPSVIFGAMGAPPLSLAPACPAAIPRSG